MRRRKIDLFAGELVAECAAFVRGGYAPYPAERCRPVPVWAWTNVLAHATEPELEELAPVEICGRFAVDPERRELVAKDAPPKPPRGGPRRRSGQG